MRPDDCTGVDKWHREREETKTLWSCGLAKRDETLSTAGFDEARDRARYVRVKTNFIRTIVAARCTGERDGRDPSPRERQHDLGRSFLMERFAGCLASRLPEFSVVVPLARARRSARFRVPGDSGATLRTTLRVSFFAAPVEEKRDLGREAGPG